MNKMNREIRSFEVRSIEGRNVTGYAVVFNSLSVDLGGFREIIAPTAISQDLLDNSDVVFNYNHDNSKVLARYNKGYGTLMLNIDEQGLRFSFEMPNTTVGNDLLELMSRGDISKCSFCFSLDPADDEADSWVRNNDEIIRTINKISGLYDCSIVTNAAYPDTEVSARSLEKINELNMKKEDIELREDPEVDEEQKEQDPEEQQEEKSCEDPKDEEREDDKTEDEESEDKSEAEEEQDKEEKDDDEEERSSNKDNSLTSNIFEENKTMKKVKYSLLKAIREAKKGQFSPITAAVNEAGQKELRESNLDGMSALAIPVGMKLEERADEPSVVTVTAEGEHVVVTDFLDILEPLRTKNVLVNSGARFLTGLRGNIQIPSMSAENVFWEGEITPAQNGAGTFSHINMSPKRLSAFIDVSDQFLMQDTLDAERIIREDLIRALNDKLEATILGEAAASGNVPAGIFNGVTPAEVGTFRDICDLEASLEENCFYGNMKYIASPSAKAALRAMPKSSKMTQLVLEADTVDGTPIDSTNHIKKGMIAYGDWSQLYIAQWGSVSLTVENITQALAATTRIVLHAWFDYAVVRPNAIAYAEIVEPDDNHE